MDILKNTITKVCSICKKEKPIGDFYKDKFRQDKLRYQCKICCDQCNKRYQIKHRNTILLQRKQYRLEHKEEINLKGREYHLKNKIKEKIFCKQYSSNPINKERRQKRKKERFQKDPIFRLHCNISSRMRWALKHQNAKKSMKTIKLLGCTALEFKNYIQSLLKPGMSLLNDGVKKWQLHHIKYCFTFDLRDIEQQKLCFHYTNVIPMWEDEHYKLHENDALFQRKNLGSGLLQIAPVRPLKGVEVFNEA